MDMYNYNSEACVSSDQGDLACAEAPYRGTVVQTGEFTAAADPVEQPLGMMVYPNPSGDWINVALRTAAPAEATLSLLGMDGRLLRQSRVSLSGGEQLFPLPAADLPAGVYLVRVQTEKSTSAVKVIVRRF